MDPAVEVDEAFGLAAWLYSMHPKCTGQHAFVVEGNPGAKARPRLGRHGGTYAPDAAEEEALAWEMMAATRVRHMGPVVVACVFYRRTRHRVDGDNLVKRVLDAGTKARLWRDDSLVVANHYEVHYDKDRPRSVIAVADLPESTTFSR